MLRTVVKPETNSARPAVILTAAAALALAVIAIYANALPAPFVFDDIPSIVENQTLARIWPPGDALSPPRGEGITVEGRPLLNYSLAINHAVSGQQTWSYRAANIAIHLGAALALFGCLRRTLAARPESARRATALAFGIALLWAVHPLQTEAVTYVIQRAEAWAGLFFLLTLYAFIRATQATSPLRSERTAWLVLSVGACLLGMASKEIMYCAPIAVLLYDRAAAAGSFRAAWQLRRGYYVALAMTWLLLGALLLSTGNRGGTAGLGVGVTPWLYARAQCEALTHYLWLSVWPHPLIFDYGVSWPKDLLTTVPHAVVVLALLGATVSCLIQRPLIGFLGACFFLILAPTSSFLPGNRQTIAEHRMYLPLAVVLTFLLLGVDRVCGRWRMQVAGWTLLAGCATAWCTLTVLRNRDYRSEVTLYQDTVAKRPGNPLAHYNLAHVLDRTGRREEAVAAYREAIRLDPNRPAVYNNLGKTLSDLGRWEEAAIAYRAALRLAPDYARAHRNLGEALLQLRDFEGAREQFSATVTLTPNDAEARDNLGGILLELGRTAEAIDQLEAVLRINPGFFQTHYMLGHALLRQGRPTEAIARFEEALRLRPDFEDAQRNLALARRQAAGR